MDSGESASDRTAQPQEMVRLLEELKRTPAGIVIYDQLVRILDDWQNAGAGTDRAYASLLSFVLETYAENPDTENIIRLSTRLIRARSSQGPLIFEGQQPAKDFSHITRQDHAGTAISPSLGKVADVGQNLASLLQVLNRALNVPTAETAETADTAIKRRAADRAVDDTPVSAAEPEEPTYPAVERRVNSAYRMHLDRKHDEIEKLQETLTQKAMEAITQNKEFGALLEIERSALQQASGIEEIEDLKEILIGGTEELIEGQQTLAEKLRSSLDYLQLVKSDSERLHEELNKVRLLSLTDEFTGLSNRRAFLRRLEDEIGRAQRYNSPLALALIDLDEFKDINDKYGHPAGDEVLRWYANSALPIFRHHDMVARYGGEEFAVLLPNTDQQGAMRALTKVRARVDGAECDFGDLAIRVPTFSAGLTLYSTGEAPAVLIERADKALYRAKRLGRDRIEIELTQSKQTEEPSSGNGT